MSHVSLQEFLKTEPDGTLEVVAEQHHAAGSSEKSALLYHSVRR